MSDEDRGANPYGSLIPAAPQTGEIVQSSRAMQEVQAAIIMAKKDPRNTILATDNALAECKRPTLARTAIYTYPRGGTNVEGPSIRLAEAIARSWGNLQYGIIEVGRDGDESSMLAYAWDLQGNNMARMEFKVKHIRDTKNGSKPLTDERDIYENNTNAAARRLRACILKLIPGDVVDACMERCKLTLEQALGRIEEAIPKMLDTFKEIGVTQQMIEKRLKKSINAISYQDLVNLGNISNAIRDGMGGPEDYFEIEPKATPKPAEGATGNAARNAAARAARPRAEPKAPEPPPVAPRHENTTPGKPLILGVKQTPLDAAKAKAYSYISDFVPIPDRAYCTGRVDAAGSVEAAEKVLHELEDQYGMF